MAFRSRRWYDGTMGAFVIPSKVRRDGRTKIEPVPSVPSQVVNILPSFSLICTSRYRPQHLENAFDWEIAMLAVSLVGALFLTLHLIVFVS